MPSRHAFVLTPMLLNFHQHVPLSVFVYVPAVMAACSHFVCKLLVRACVLVAVGVCLWDLLVFWVSDLRVKACLHCTNKRNSIAAVLTYCNPRVHPLFPIWGCGFSTLGRYSRPPPPPQTPRPEAILDQIRCILSSEFWICLRLCSQEIHTQVRLQERLKLPAFCWGFPALTCPIALSPAPSPWTSLSRRTQSGAFPQTPQLYAKLSQQGGSWS